MFDLDRDPRVEAVARVLCVQTGKAPDELVTFDIEGVANGEAVRLAGEWPRWMNYAVEAARCLSDGERRIAAHVSHLSGRA